MYSSYDASSTYPNYAAPATTSGASLEYSIISSLLNPSASGASSTQNGQRPQQASPTFVNAQPQAGLVAATWPAVEPQYTTGQQAASSGFSGATSSSNAFPSTTRTSTNAADMSPPSVTESAAYMRLQNQYGTSDPSASFGQTSSTSGEPSFDYQSGGQAGSSSSASLPFASPPVSILSPYNRARATPPAWGSTSNSVPTMGDAAASRAPAAGSTTSYANGTAAVANIGGQLRESGSVYKMVTKKYDYTQGYHFLMKHISCRCVSPLCASQMDDLTIL